MDECAEPSNLDNILLYGQDNHRSQSVLDGDVDMLLSCRRKGGVPGHDNPCKDVRVLRYLHTAGFYGLYNVGNVILDWPLITALVERFRPETHTFHLPPGECTVTLQDVQILLGLRIDGTPVTGFDGGDEVSKDWIPLVERLLGKRPEKTDIRGGRLSINWLTKNFKELEADADDNMVRCHTRAIILMILGGHYLSDKSGSHAWLLYLPLLEDFELCGTYSWGSAILAFLYREMCVASNKKKKTISGPLILLQIWAWSRLTQIRPQHFKLPPYPEIPPPADGGVPLPTYPLGYRWAEASYSSHRDLRWYRDQFDQTLDEQILWEPYEACIETLPSYCVDSKELWLSQVPLIYYNVIEYHHPERVKRQFGMKQTIPINPLKDAKHLLKRQGKGKVDWAEEHGDYVTKWAHRWTSLSTGEISRQAMLPDDPYIQWYRKNTLLRVTPITNVPPSRGFHPTGGRDNLMASYFVTLYDMLDEPSFDKAKMKQFMSTAFEELKLDPKVIPRLPKADLNPASASAPNPNPISTPIPGSYPPLADMDWGLFDGFSARQHDTVNIDQMDLDETPIHSTRDQSVMQKETLAPVQFETPAPVQFETPAPVQFENPAPGQFETPVPGQFETPAPGQFETPAPGESETPATQDQSEMPAPRMRNYDSICRDDSLMRAKVTKRGRGRPKKDKVVKEKKK